MKRIFLTTLLLPTLLYGQDYITDFDRYNPSYKYEWIGLEKHDRNLKGSFKEFCKTKQILTGERRIIENMESEFQQYVSTVDLNADGKLDIVYNGPSGGEAEIIHLFMNTGDSFEHVFEDTQGIVKIDWQGELIEKLFVHDWGCCADTRLFNRVYQVTYSMHIPSFHLIWQSVELNRFVVKPKTYFKKAIRFKVDNHLYQLRYSPVIDDSTEDEFLETVGNSIGKLTSGTTGTAYASKVDDTGRIWWYVLIDPEFEIIDNKTHYDKSEHPTHVIGWLSSRYVSVLE